MRGVEVKTMASLAAWVFAVCAALTVLSVGRVQAAYGSPAGAVVFVLGVALLIAAVVASRWAHARCPDSIEAWQLAAQARLDEGRAVLRLLERGQRPSAVTLWGVVLEPGESAYLDVPVRFGRFYGRDLDYPGVSRFYLGGGGPALAFAASCIVLGDAVDRGRARVEATPHWRDYEHTRAILTNRRLLVRADQEWRSFSYSQVKAFHPNLDAGWVDLEFMSCAPLRLESAATPAVAAWLCWAVHGPDALRAHPALAALR
jgi:hypothetical protein